MTYRIPLAPGTDPRTVTLHHFGTNYLANRQGQGETLENSGAYADAAQWLGVTCFRYPGGTIAESYLDITDMRHFEAGAGDAILAQHFADASDTTGLTRLGAFLDFAAARAAEVTIVLPMVRFMETIRTGTAQEIATLEAQVKAFVTEALAYRSGAAIKGFEIGNEFPSWMGGHNGDFLDSTADAAALMRNMAVWVNEALEDAGADHVGIIAHTAFVKYGDKGNNPLLRRLFDDGLDQDYAHVESTADFFKAVDGVSSHFYPWQPWAEGSSGSGSIREDIGLIADWQSAFDSYAAAQGLGTRPLQALATEWNLRNASYVQDQISCLQGGLGTVSLFHQMIAQGIDEAQVWPVLQNNQNTLVSHDGEVTSMQMPGATFALLRTLTPGLAAGSAVHARDMDGDGSDDLFLYTFSQGNAVTSFVAAARAMTVTLDFAGFGLDADRTQAHVATLGETGKIPELHIDASRELAYDQTSVTLSLAPWELSLVTLDEARAAATGGVAGALPGTAGASFGFAHLHDVAALLPEGALTGSATGTLLRAGDRADAFQILPGFAADGGGGADSILGTAGADTVLGGTGNDTISLHDGNDIIAGGSGSDLLIGGAGHDRIRGGPQEDVIHGGSGDDVLSGEAGFDLIRGGRGNDYADGSAQADNLLGGSGDDTLLGGSGLDRLFGEDGNDVLRGGSGRDGLFGGNGDDLLLGGSGDDILVGHAGFDRLEGGQGNDILVGAFNADTFVFSGDFGQDEIRDFEARNPHEKIDLSGVASITDYGDLSAHHLSQTAEGALIDAGGGNQILLRGVAVKDLDPGDFLF
ncbi:MULTISPECIES: calcium-binding protein [Pseudooceanicola]|nr:MULTISPECIES: calcium-binding protein [Pseudooceanicola]